MTRQVVLESLSVGNPVGNPSPQHSRIRKNKRHVAPAPVVRFPAPRATGHPFPTALAAHPARRGGLASVPRRQAEHGAAGAAWLWRVLDRRLRMGEGSAAGGPWGDGRVRRESGV